MKEIRIGNKIIEKRKELKLTQEELADHLGVSKPAVSKWESGQSYPDITLLPVIATYFDITVDELFDYQPQLTKQEIRKVYRSLAERFTQEPFDEVMTELNTLMKKYYSCWPLLLNLGILLMNHADLAGSIERRGEVLQDALRLFERIEQNCDDPKILRQTPLFKATCWMMLGNPSEVIDLLGEADEVKMNPDILLANAYLMKQENEKALNLLQGSIFTDLLSIVGAMPGMMAIYATQPETLDRWSQSIERLIDIFDFDHLHPASVLPFHVNAAALYLSQHRVDPALHHLERYARIACEPGLFPFTLKGNAQFDHIQALIESLDLGSLAPRSDQAIKQSFKDLLKHPAFESLAENDRFKRIVRDLDAL